LQHGAQLKPTKEEMEMAKNSHTQEGDRVARKPEVSRITGMSDTTIWRMEQIGKFPKRLRLGGNSCGWLLSEVNGWLAERAAARS